MFDPIAWLKNLWQKKETIMKQETPFPPFSRLTCNLHEVPSPPAIPSDEELGILRQGPMAVYVMPCPHHEAPRAYTYRVYGTIVELSMPMTRCIACTQTLLEKVCLRCAKCDGAIWPTCNIGIAWIGAPHPFTHMKCAETNLLQCGAWGWGRLMTLHEMDDDVPEGTATVNAYFAERARQNFEDPPTEAAPEEEDAASDDTPPEGTPKAGVN